MPSAFVDRFAIGQSGLDQAAIAQVASSRGIQAENLRVLNSALVNLTYTHVQYWETKVIGLKSGMVFDVALDLTGKPVDVQQLLLHEQAAHDLSLGKLTPKLANYLLPASPTEKVTVLIWLSSNSSGPGPYAPRHALLEAATQRARSAQKALLAALQSDELVYASIYAPLVVARLTPARIRQLSRSTGLGILMIDISRNYELADLVSVTQTTQARVVWDRGFTGGNVTAAVVEWDRVGGWANNALIPVVATNIPTGVVGEHATQVAGIIASRAGFSGIRVYGMAYASNILSANTGSYSNNSDPYLIQAIEWAITNGANVLTHSYSAPITNNPYSQFGSAYVSFMDYIVSNLRVTQTIAAGNYGVFNSYNVTTPGVSHNAITVGSYSDMNTPDWNDDRFSDFSCYVVQSPHGDEVKPDVINVGELIISTGVTQPLSGYTKGTSFATPGVAGIAALLMSRNSTLKIWPEAVKAIIMATAAHDLGQPRNIQGAGAVVASYADGALTAFPSAWVDYGVIHPNPSWNSTPGVIVKSYNIYAFPGLRVRAAFVWDYNVTASSPDAAYGQPDSLLADFDMTVMDPNGNVVATDTTFDNNNAWVDFIAPTSGFYTVNIVATTWNSNDTGEQYGFSYWTTASGTFPYTRYLPVVRDQPSQGVTTTITVNNVSPVAIMIQAFLYDTNGNTLNVYNNFMTAFSTLTLTGRSMNNGNQWAGSMRLLSTSPIQVLVTIQGGPSVTYAATQNTGSALYVQAAGNTPYSTQVYVLNPDVHNSVNIALSLYDQTGLFIKTVSLSLGPEDRYDTTSTSLNGGTQFSGIIVVNSSGNLSIPQSVVVMVIVTNSSTGYSYDYILPP
jgi:hypothetical protein